MLDASATMSSVTTAAADFTDVMPATASSVDSTSQLLATIQPLEVVCVSQPQQCGVPRSGSVSQPCEVPPRSSGTWARKRRSRPISLASVRNDAATSISSAAEVQTKFYESKLEMAGEEHAVKMRILHLKEELLKKKLSEE